MRPTVVWGGLLAAGVAYEAYGVFGEVEGDTLSEVTRQVFRTEHPVGKAVFVCAWAALSVWLVPHIVAKASEAVIDAMDAIAAE
jgi:hypothetical protein